MKKSLRFTAAGLSVCMMAVMLAGCGSSSSATTEAEADSAAETEVMEKLKRAIYLLHSVPIH